MDEGEIDQLFVGATVEALIGATAEEGPETKPALQQIIDSALNVGDEVQMLLVAIGLARAAGPTAAATWTRMSHLVNFENPVLDTESRRDALSHIDLVSAVYRHALHDDVVSFSELAEQWDDGGPPAHLLAVATLLSMATTTRQDGWG